MGWIRLNRDDLRAMLHDSVWTRENEKIVVDIQETLIHQALTAGLNVIVDDTNFGRNIERLKGVVHSWWKELSHESQLGLEYPSIQVHFFPISLEEALARNNLRNNPVPATVIQDMYERYISHDTKIEIEEI